MNESVQHPSAPLGMVTVREGRILEANEAACEMLGRPIEAVLGRSFEDLLEPEEAARVRDRYVRRQRGEPVPREYEVALRRADGARRVIEVFINADEALTMVFMRDVTDVAERRARRFALAQLGAALHRHRTEAEVMRALREGCVRIALSGAWLRPTRDDGLRVEYSDLPDGGAGFTHVVGEGYVGSWTSWFRRAWTEGIAYVDDAVLEVARFVGQPWEAAVHDLAASIEMTRGVAIRIDVGNVPEALLVLRGDWLREDDVVTASLLRTQLSAALDNARHISDAWRRVRDLERVNTLASRVLELTPQGPDAVRACAAEVALDACADDALARVIEGVTKVGIENATRYAEAEARFSDLRDTQARLIERERLAALGEVAAVVAHEVRNPLGVIFNSVSALRKLVLREDDASALIEVVREEADRLNQIVGDLLDFARPLAPQRRPESLASLVDSALGAAMARASNAASVREIKLAIDLPEDLPHAFVDARLMRQALLNVMLNAVEAMPTGGTLRVSARATNDGFVEVSVHDSGQGIAPEARARIFEPFFTTRASGTGLGLAVVKRMIDAHHGEVRVDDMPGIGTIFTLRVEAAPPSTSRG